MKHTVNELKNWPNTVKTSDGQWVPARPENHKFESWSERLKHAWGVLTGKYDALDWRD